LVDKKPYTEMNFDKFGLNHVIRIFSEDVNEDELVWHRDKEDRKVHVLEGIGWMLQLDNEEPVELEKGKGYYFIPKMVYHRIIKGEGSLTLEIEEENGD
tara:strand:- start:200 stop:496 length:297 start_codon:yes stop_codon:yes gene_type:complete